MTTELTKRELKDLIKTSVKEVLEVELMRLRATALSEVTAKEQQDIDRHFGSKPSRRYIKTPIL